MLHQAGFRSGCWYSRQHAPHKMHKSSVLFCKMTLFIITKNGDIDYFTGGQMDVIYQADDEYFNFFEEQFRELQAKKSQSIITRVFRAPTGTRCKTRWRQITGIATMLVTMGLATPLQLHMPKPPPHCKYQLEPILNHRCQKQMHPCSYP